MVEKVRITEKDFPAGIPEDIGDRPLEVVSETGETMALFFNTSFMGQKFQDPMEYIKHYDDIFNYWDIWQTSYWRDECAEGPGGMDEAEGEQTEHITRIRMEDAPDFNWQNFEKYRYLGRAIVALCRLAYPYHLRNFELVDQCLHEVVTVNYFVYRYVTDDSYLYENMYEYERYEPGMAKLVFEYDDLRLIAEYLKRIVGFEDLIDVMIKNNRIGIMYEHPELFITAENIDLFIDSANKSKNTDLMTFLLDHKNRGT